MLTLLDENNFLGVSQERTITPARLKQFEAALGAVTPQNDRAAQRLNDWIECANLLQIAPTADLQAPSWRLPRLPPQWARAVQSAGLVL
jgi:hypothetical protein